MTGPGPVAHPGDRLSALLDGELHAAEVDAVLDHLAVCPPCEAELVEVRAGRDRLRAAPAVEPPARDLLPAPAVHVGDAISALLDGEVDPFEAAGIEAHLAACSACAAEAEEVSWARDRIRALPPVVPPPGVLRPEGGAVVTLRLPRRRAWGAVAVAAAAAFVGVLALAGQPAPNGPARPSVAGLVAEHGTASPAPDLLTGLAPVAVPVSFRR